MNNVAGVAREAAESAKKHVEEKANQVAEAARQVAEMAAEKVHDAREAVESVARDAGTTAREEATKAAKAARKVTTKQSFRWSELFSAGAKIVPVLAPVVSTLAAKLGERRERAQRSANMLQQGVSFGAGVIVGAGLGLLVAPRSGAELRMFVRRYFADTPLDEIADRVVEKAEAASKVIGKTAASASR